MSNVSKIYLLNSAGVIRFDYFSVFFYIWVKKKTLISNCNSFGNLTGLLQVIKYKAYSRSFIYYNEEAKPFRNLPDVQGK